MRNLILKWFIARLLLLFFVLLIIAGCDKRVPANIPYPQPPPADSILSFLPGIVCTGGDSIDFNAAFSPDGKSFYFSRSQNRKWDMYVSNYEGGQWTKARKATFNSDLYSEADPAVGPDGSIYYISDRPKDKSDTLRDFDIWFVKPLPDGQWTAPQHMAAVNSDSTEYYVSFAGDGNLYFASSRPGGYGREDIYVSKLVDGAYRSPENLGAEINSPYSDHDPSLPKNERFIVFTSVDRKEGFGEGDLYFSIRGKDGRWSQGKNIGGKFNTPTYEYCSYFSPDGNYFFFSSERDVKWMRTESLPRELAALINDGDSKSTE